MNHVLFEIPIPWINFSTWELLVFRLPATAWKLIGWVGVFLFTARWLVQMLASRKHGRPVIPAMFWYLSILGSLMCLAYFVWGKNDSVGILGYLFPTGVAIYNLYLHIQNEKRGAGRS